MATTLYPSIHYWLVDHPIISQYEWDSGKSPTASLLFLTTSVVGYLSLTLLFYHFPILPTLSASTLRLPAASHSILLCLLSLVMAIGCTLSVLHQTPPENLTWSFCFPAAAETRGPTFFWAHIFYLSKILEYVDTLLILLSSSRSRRLSFLHVYHHAVVPVMVYTWLEAPMSSFPLGVAVNAAVHALMYAYYMAAALGFRPQWKRVLTGCQIVQFLLGIPFSSLLLYFHFTGSGCSGMRAWAFTYLATSLIFALFVDFYLKNYTHKKKSGDPVVSDKGKTP